MGVDMSQFLPRPATHTHVVASRLGTPYDPLAFDESYGAGGDREGSSTERYERWMAAPQIYFADGAEAVERLRPLGAKMHGQASAAMLAASSPVCSEYWAVNMEDLSPPSYSAFA